MNILVISSCSKTKQDSHKATAGEMYAGPQHNVLMEGLKKVRNKFGGQVIDLAIISARHGLIMENYVIESYNCTFSNLPAMEILERSKRLQIHEKAEALISGYDLVFFLMGKNYVQALQLPFDVPDSVTQIFLAGESYKHLIPENADFFAAGTALARQLHKTVYEVKGYVFKRLCCAACREGLEVFERIRQPSRQIFDFSNCSTAIP